MAWPNLSMINYNQKNISLNEFHLFFTCMQAKVIIFMKFWVFSLWTISTDWETRLLHCVVEHDKNIQNVSNSLLSMAVLSNTLPHNEAPISLWFLCFHPPLLLCAPREKLPCYPGYVSKKGHLGIIAALWVH